MADDAVARLEEALGAAPPKGVVRALDEDELAHLAELIEVKRSAQRQELRAATEASFKHIPFPLRGAIKKLLRS